MSRVAKNPVVIPTKVEVQLSAEGVAVSGPLGKLFQPITNAVELKIDGDNISFRAVNDSKSAVSMSGTLRSLVANMVHGVSVGYSRKLTLVGVGYRRKLQGSVLNLELGFSHPVRHELPVGIVAETPTQTEILLKGVDKQVVGQVAAQIRAYRPPEPYKGKGVRYSDEVVAIKETKKK